MTSLNFNITQNVILTEDSCIAIKLKLFVAWRPAGQLPERKEKDRINHSIIPGIVERTSSADDYGLANWCRLRGKRLCEICFNIFRNKHILGQSNSNTVNPHSRNLNGRNLQN